MNGIYGRLLLAVAVLAAIGVTLAFLLLKTAPRLTRLASQIDSVPAGGVGPSDQDEVSGFGNPRQSKFASLASITIVLRAPAELLVTDPDGRRTGMDPRTGISYNEIPDAFYYREAIADPTGEKGTGPFQEYKVFDLPEPLDGDYTIEVIGTGRGDYGLDVVNYDELGDPAEATVLGQIETDAVHTYLMTYISSPNSEVRIMKK